MLHSSSRASPIPAVNSPAASTFADVLGFAEFAKRLAEMRKADPHSRPCHRTSNTSARAASRASPSHGELELEIVLAKPNPQILYWFAMPFTTPMPWEAVAYYDGKEGRGQPRRSARSAPARSGSPPMTNSTASRWSATRTGTAIGREPAPAPGAVFPADIEPRGRQSGRDRSGLCRAAAAVPRTHRVHARTEGIPRFNKFLQGYYDDGGIIKESFDAIIKDDQLSPEMVARGMRLDKEVEPTIFYLGFNMDDPVRRARSRREGPQAAPGHEHRRRRTDEYLRAIPQRPRSAGAVAAAAGDLRLRQGLQEPVPAAGPRARASSCSRKPATRTASTRRPATAQAELRHRQHDRRRPLLQYEFLVGAWRQLGLDVEINATTYNQFQEKVRQGAYQIFLWGWIADFPDPENFLFLPGLRERAHQEPRAEHGELLRSGVRRALPRDEEPAEQRAARRAHPAHGGDPRAGAAVDRAIPPRELHAEPCLAGQRQADGHLLSRPTSTRT